MPAPQGLTGGRVVHYTPVNDYDGLALGIQRDSGGYLVGSISRVDSPELGQVTLHLNALPPLSWDGAPRLESDYQPVLVRTDVLYDPNGAPGTWRFPPRA